MTLKRLELQLRERELEAQIQQKELESKTAKLQAQTQADVQIKQREIESNEKIALQRLTLQSETVSVDRTSLNSSDKATENAKKALPTFNDTTDIDSYLTLFERTMLSFHIEENRWPSELQSQMTGSS